MGRVRNLRPGAKVPRSGQYQQTGPRRAQDKEVTSVKGERLPPTPRRGMTYTLVDATKNESGRGR